MRGLRSFLACTGGQSLAEIAIATPILTFALIGGVDLLRVAAVQQAVINAARVGAEFAAADPAHTDPDTTTQVTNELSRTPGLVAGSAVITLPTRDTTSGRYKGTFADGTPGCIHTTAAANPCFVAVSVRYTFTTLFAWPLVPNQALVNRSVAMPMVD